ncbi:MAG: DUF2066 domain-containing protein [Gammaproteobacteria bacterium]|nr:MAG: DUF2066 domain-containing protein [Gammaproteobacteria bacterium]
MKIIYLFIILLMVSLNQLSADEGYAFKEHYEVKVSLQGTDRPSIEDGMQKAFEELMINLSGLSDSLQNKEIEKALIQPQKYVTQYRLSSDDEKVLGVFSFDGDLVRGLLSKNSLPIWIGIKPKALLFLPCVSKSLFLDINNEIEFKKNILCQATKNKLLEIGALRNVVFIEPALDLLDLNYIDLYQPQSENEHLKKLANRYGLDGWVACYIEDQFGIVSEESYCLSPFSKLKRTSLEDTVNILADELNKDFQLNIDPEIRNEITLKVEGIKDYQNLASLDDLFSSNALVVSYSLSSLSPNGAIYLLVIRGGVSDLRKLMNVNPILGKDVTKDLGVDLQYRLNSKI